MNGAVVSVLVVLLLSLNLLLSSMTECSLMCLKPLLTMSDMRVKLILVLSEPTPYLPNKHNKSLPHGAL